MCISRDPPSGKYCPGPQTRDPFWLLPCRSHGAAVAMIGSGADEWDDDLYDEEKQSLLPTPGLNSKEDDIDPCVIVLPTQK
jgi:hypothetical protein